MKVKIKFTKDSPYYQVGERERVVDNLTEVHYSYPNVVEEKSTAFESDIDQTWVTIFNDWIEEFEITI